MKKNFFTVKRLRNMVENTSSRSGKIFHYVIQFLIVFSLLAFSLETLPGNSETMHLVLFSIDAFCVVLFSLEYTLRIITAKKKWAYIFSFYGLIDLIAILPFYLYAIGGFMSLRVFRMFRTFRVLKLSRYNKAMHRFQIAARIVKEELILFFSVVAAMILLSATGIFFFENEAQPEKFASVFHSLWWATVTITTVGYGDSYPITLGGKIFTFFVLIIGLVIVTVPAGLVSSALSEARELEEKERKKVSG